MSDTTGRDPYSGKLLLGKYRCLELLSRSDRSLVYRVQHVKLNSTRAMKLLRPEFCQDPNAVKAFWHEGTIAAALRHPSLAILHDVDALPDTTPCLIYELIEGTTLTARVAKGPTAQDAARVVRGLCSALQHLHDRAIFHLDLCPDNVMVLADGEPRLIDFGEARKLGWNAPRLELLRPGFSATEQLQPGVEADARADVFALGALICFAYNGTPPLSSPDLDTYRQAITSIAPAQLEGVRALPAAVRAIVARCLAPNPADRPADAAAVRREIRNLAKDASDGSTDVSSISILPQLPPPTAVPTSGTAATRQIQSMDPNATPIAMPPPQATVQSAHMAEHRTVPLAHLEPVAGDSHGPFLLGPENTIGRLRGNHILLTHPTVSKHHAVIAWNGQSFTIQDLGSRNGSSVNGRPVRQVVILRNGDTLMLGDVVFRFRAS